jgi:outer membrane protein
VRNFARTLAAAGFVFAAAIPAFAQDSANIEHVRALIAQAAAQQGGTPAPVTGQAPFVTPGPRVDLSIQDAAARALDKNIDIAVARITPRLVDFTLAGLEASYRLNLTSALSNNRTTDLPRVSTQGISEPTTSARESWSSGIAQNLWKGGGNYAVSWTNSRFKGQSSVNLRNPQFQSGLTANLTQPLWRGFKIDATRAALRTNRLVQQNDEISLDLASRLVQDNRSRVEIGTLAPIDIVSAQAEQASRRNTLVLSQATLRTAELALKRLIVSGTDDPLWTSSINPVDRPSTTPEPINLEAAVARALSIRTDLQQSKNNLQISDINLQNQVDATKPQLNLIANYGLSGLGGPIFRFTGPVDPNTGAQPSTTIPSGYLDALRNIAGFDAPVWTVGLNFAYPLGKSAQEATVARSKLSLQQTQVNLKALELQIATDVTNAALTVQSSLESVQASAAARDFAEKRLEAAQSKADVGMATNYEVVQAQRDFADARNNELRAVLNYRKALVNFETAQTVGTRGVGAAVAGGGQ